MILTSVSSWLRGQLKRPKKMKMPHIWTLAALAFARFFDFRVRGPRPPAVYLCTLIYSSDLHFPDISPRTIRTDRPKNSCMRSARVDLLRSRLYFVDFWSGLAVPSENMHFQHPEPLKNQVFRNFSNFLRHASSWCSTELSKACKICLSEKSVQLLIQLRGSAAEPIPARENPGLKFSKHAAKKCYEM